jgi:hypothetical protein
MPTRAVPGSRRLPSECSLVTRRVLLAAVGLAPFTARSAQAAERIAIAELWAAGSEFSQRAKELAGKAVELRGYMAPPLKPEVDFFVLTTLPMAVCPFCDNAAAWPEDIVLIFLDRPVRAIPYDRLISVTGTLQIGTATDAATGFVSRVRLHSSKYARV